MRFQLVTYFLLTLFLCINTYAKEINIDELIHTKELQPKTTITLQGKTFDILQKLGAGNTTTIYEIYDGKKSYALRVPKGSGKFNTFSNYSDYINAYKQGHGTLDKQGISVPGLFNFVEDQFLIVEKLELEDAIDLHGLFFNPDNFSKEVQAESLLALEDFVKEISIFETIKDFHLRQAFYIPSEKKWKLMDWTSSHELFTSTDSKVPLDIKVLESAWKNEVYYLHNKSEDLSSPSEYKPAKEVSNLFEKLDKITKENRKEILELEIANLNRLKNKLEFANSAKEIIEIISDTPSKFSNNYIESVFKFLSEKGLDFSGNYLALPNYLYSDNKNYLKLLDLFVHEEMLLDDLVNLLDLRENIQMKSNWPLEMKIQKAITNNTENFNDEIYEKLLEKKLVSNYAKAWIRREFLNKSPSQKCSDVIKVFL